MTPITSIITKDGKGYVFDETFEVKETRRAYHLWQKSPLVLCKTFFKSNVRKVERANAD